MPATPALGSAMEENVKIGDQSGFIARPSLKKQQGIEAYQSPPGFKPQHSPEAAAAAPWVVTSDAPDLKLILCELEAGLGCSAAHLKQALLAVLAPNMNMRSGPMHGPVCGGG